MRAIIHILDTKEKFVIPRHMIQEARLPVRGERIISDLKEYTIYDVIWDYEKAEVHLYVSTAGM